VRLDACATSSAATDMLAPSLSLACARRLRAARPPRAPPRGRPCRPRRPRAPRRPRCVRTGKMAPAPSPHSVLALAD
jgi:hypothetical protein